MTPEQINSLIEENRLLQEQLNHDALVAENKRLRERLSTFLRSHIGAIKASFKDMLIVVFVFLAAVGILILCNALHKLMI